jgi:hypothetical protein
VREAAHESLVPAARDYAFRPLRTFFIVEIARPPTILAIATISRIAVAARSLMELMCTSSSCN